MISSVSKLMLLSVISSLTYAAQYYSVPKQIQSGAPNVGLMWVPASHTTVDNYKNIADAISQAGSDAGVNMFVGVADFVFDVPDPVEMDGQIKTFVSKTQDAGYNGDNLFIAGHGLGGVISQQYAESSKDYAKQIKGSILAGSVLLRDYHNLTMAGDTYFTINKPTYTLLGNLDGQMRITRGAEQYYHQILNIQDSQKYQFPLEVLEGLSHWSFASGDMPSYVKSNDFIPTVSESDAHALVSKKIMNFVSSILGLSEEQFSTGDFTHQYYQPMIDAMTLEGSYYMKPACYNSTMENDHLPTCLAGSPWVVTAHEMMADYSNWDNPLITLEAEDNFHRAYSLFPYHHPEIHNKCEQDTTEKCAVKILSVTENLYTKYNEFDTGRYQISAIDHKAKLLARETILQASGKTDVDFHQTDEVGNRCGEINQAALDWALKNADADAVTRYNSVGEKMTIGDDTGPYNDGPQWIWYEVEKDENSDKTDVVIKSPTMVEPTEFWITASAGIHFCKLISPFTALEWIYVDSLYSHYTPATHAAQDLLFLQ